MMAGMPAAADPKRKPTSVKVHVSTGAGVDVEWADGHRSHYDFDYLRENCPCATCDDERRKKKDAPAAAAGGAGPELPMFKPRPRAQSAEAVGHYAIRITYSDGHFTGIYSFDYLRSICPCDACARGFRR
jgi:DUF971 family protein